MQLECEKPILEEAITTVSRAINARSPLPILSHILMQAQDDTLTLTATDLDLGLCCRMPARIVAPGALACPARLISEIVSKLPSAPVTLSGDGEGRLHLHCGRSKFELASLPAEEFPSMPSGSKYPSLELPQRQFRSMIRRVAVAVAASDESRAVMTGILTRIDGSELALVATDGRRLAYVEHQLSEPLEAQVQVIVPGKAMLELGRLMSDSDENLDLRIAESQIFCSVRNISMHCRLLEGTFPDYRRVLPQSFQGSCRVGREALLAGLKRMLIVALEKQSPNLIVLDLNSERLLLSANTPDLGGASEEIAMILEGPDLRIAFNGKYLAEGLATLDCDEVEIDLQDDTRSAVVRPYGEADFRYVLMPVRLRDPVVEEAEPVGAGV